MTDLLFIFIVIDVAYVIYVILSEQKTTSGFCSSNADVPITQDDKSIAEQTSENSLLASAEQADEKQLTNVAGKVREIEKELAHISAALQEKTKTVGSDALDLVKHPRRYAELGASLAESMAGESLGEIVGASLGTMFGPEGTVIGAEVGGMAGEVFGARQQKSFSINPRRPPLERRLAKRRQC